MKQAFTVAFIHFVSIERGFHLCSQEISSIRLIYGNNILKSIHRGRALGGTGSVVGPLMFRLWRALHGNNFEIFHNHSHVQRQPCADLFRGLAKQVRHNGLVRNFYNTLNRRGTRAYAYFPNPAPSLCNITENVVIFVINGTARWHFNAVSCCPWRSICFNIPYLII